MLTNKELEKITGVFDPSHKQNVLYHYMIGDVQYYNTSSGTNGLKSQPKKKKRKKKLWNYSLRSINPYTVIRAITKE